MAVRAFPRCVGPHPTSGVQWPPNILSFISGRLANPRPSSFSTKSSASATAIRAYLMARINTVNHPSTFLHFRQPRLLLSTKAIVNDEKKSDISAGKRADLWSQRYRELLEYKDEFGDCQVPITYEQNRALGMWVDRQRSLLRYGILPLERQKKLDEAGFVWKMYEESWEERYRQLQDYNNHHHHCRVPLRYEPNLALGKWVQRQRKLYADGKLQEDRIKRLHSLNFCWSELDARWEERLKEYIKYVAINQEQPTRKRDSSLHYWMKVQLQLPERAVNGPFERTPLNPERIADRIKKLKAANFPFKT